MISDMFYEIMHGPYSEMLRGKVKIKPMPTVLHQKTCPKCGRTLVNIYYSEVSKDYKCKRCLDEEHPDDRERKD